MDVERAKLPKPYLDYRELDGGNAHAILAAWMSAARRVEWPEEEISKVVEEAKKHDYNHLVGTILAYSDLS